MPTDPATILARPVTREVLADLQAASAAAAKEMAAIGRHARRFARQFAAALNLRDPARRHCLVCRRRFPGPWQLRKHERTAHG